MKHYNDLIRNVKQQFDWDTYVRTNHTVKSTPSDELRICCFVCGEDKFKLYVNPVKGTFCCFKCDFSMKHHDVIDFVAKSENITRHQALTQLVREYAKVTPPDQEWEEQVVASAELVPEVKAHADIRTIPRLPEGLKPLLKGDDESDLFWTYLTNRGITPDEIRAVGFHYSPASSLRVLDSKGKFRGDLANRVVIPVYGGDHRLVSWQGRSVDPKCGKGDRYLTAPESDLSKTLWPYVKPHGKHAVLVEGVFDCLSCRRVRDLTVYATFSKKISVDQILLLKSWGVEEVTLFWDKRDAKPDMLRAIPELLMHFKRVFVVNMDGWPVDQDAGNLLADPEGPVKLKQTLDNRIDTYDDLAFTQWRLEF